MSNELKHYNFLCLNGCSRRFTLKIEHEIVLKSYDEFDVEQKGITCIYCGVLAKHIGYKFNVGGNDTALKHNDQRAKHQKDLLQPFRSGELSKEFVDEYPDQTKKMIDDKAITKSEANQAKEVWD